MATSRDLQLEIEQKIAALQAELAKVRESDKRGAVERVLAIVDEYGLTPSDIFGAKTPRAVIPQSQKKPVVAKYQGQEENQLWSGRGLKPKWVQTALANGKKLDDLLINKKSL